VSLEKIRELAVTQRAGLVLSGMLFYYNYVNSVPFSDSLFSNNFFPNSQSLMKVKNQLVCTEEKPIGTVILEIEIRIF